MEGQQVFAFQSDFICLAGGLGFLYLAAYAASLAGFRQKARRPWLWLAFFGALRGASLWTAALSMPFQGVLWLYGLQLSLEAVSYFCLFEFARASLGQRELRLGAWLAVPLGLGGLLLAYLGCCGSVDALRWTVGVPGSALAAVSLLLASRDKASPLVSRGRKLLAFSFVAYCAALVFEGLQAGASSGSLADSEASSLRAEMLLGSLAALLAGLSLWTLKMEECRQSSERPLRRLALIHCLLSLTLLSAVLIGWKASGILGDVGTSSAKEVLRSSSNNYARTVYFKHVQSLTGQKQDAELPAFKRLNAQLKDMLDLNPGWRWTYLMGIRDGKLYSLVDSLPPGDVDASPSSYEEAPSIIFELMKSGRSCVYGPYKDRWGEWISSFSPVFDDVNGRAIALFAIDVDVRKWRQMELEARLFGIASTALISFLILVGIFLYGLRASRPLSPGGRSPFRYLETAYVTVFCLSLTCICSLAMQKAVDYDLRMSFYRLAERRAESCTVFLGELRVNILTLLNFIKTAGVADNKALHSFSAPFAERLGEGNALGWISGSPPAVRWIEPHMGNEALFGADLSSDKLCSEALRQADALKLRAITGPFLGAQGRKVYYIFQPMYSDGGALATSPPAAFSLPVGYALAVWNLNSLLSYAAFLNSGGDETFIKMRFLDVVPGRPAQVVAAFPEAAPSDAMNMVDAKLPLRMDMAFSVFGHPFLFRCVPSDAYLQAHASWMPLIIFSAGLLLSASLAVLAFILQSGRSRAEDLVRERTAELQRSETRFAQVSELSREMIWEVDSKGAFTYVSQGSLGLLGLRPDELLGRRRIFEFTLGTGVDKSLELFLRKEPLKDCVCELFKRDGGRLWTSRNAIPVFGPSGEFSGYRGSDYDITMSKEAERISDSQAHFLQSLLDSIPIPVFYKGVKGEYLGCNESFMEYMGLSKSQILGKTIFDLGRSDAPDRHSKIEEELVRFGGSKSYEAVIRGGDGKGREFLVSKAAFLNPDSSPGGVIGVMMDISDRKRVEGERLRNEAHLESLLRLSQFHSKSLEDLLDFALEQALRLSSSGLGFIYAFNEQRNAFQLTSLLRFNGLDVSVPEQDPSGLPEIQAALSRIASEGKPCISNPGSAAPGEGPPPKRTLAVPVCSKAGPSAALIVAGKPSDYEPSDILQLSLLMESIWKIYERNQAEEKVRQDLKSLTVILNILHMAMEDMPLESVLGMALKGLVSMSWFDFTGKCSILLYDNERKTLYPALELESGGPVETVSCKDVCIGSCLCGMAAEGKRLVFAKSDDPCHSLSCGLSSPHAHYCVPILYGQHLVGVLNMVVGVNHQRHRSEENFLQAVAGVLAVVIQRRHADEDLMQAHDANQMLLSAIPSMMISLDKERRVLQLNPVARRSLSLKESVVIGQPLGLCGIKWDWDVISSRLDAIERGEAASSVDEVFYTRPDGQDGYLRVSITPIRGVVKGSAETLVIAEDVTERRSLETQLLQSQKLEAIGQLAAGIAHEINTPTQYIGDNLLFLQDSFKSLLSYCERIPLSEGEASGLPASLLESLKAAIAELDLDFIKDEAPKALQQAIEGVSRISEIVHAMKEFSHPGVKGRSLVDLNRALSNTVTVARNEWKYVAEMNLELSPGLPPVPCLPGEINQVFLNIIVNAAHAIGDVIGKSGAKGLIRVSSRLDGEMAEFRISDSGTGIPDSIKDRIFEPFFTTKGVGKGTGQGLSIARNIIVKKHGGELFFETEPGKGTTFVIRLPVKDSAPPPEGELSI